MGYLLIRIFPSLTNRYLDLEAVELGESGEEENLDKYESDFIDDGNDLADGDGYSVLFHRAISLLTLLLRTPIPWPRTPSPPPKQLTGKSATAVGTSGSTKRAQTPKQDTVTQAL
jgi:hypothetical protein